MTQYFDRLEHMRKDNDNGLPSRFRFLIQDVLDLRKRRWRVSENQKTDGPKLLSQVHMDHAMSQGGKGGGRRGGKINPADIGPQSMRGIRDGNTRSAPQQQ